jgi:hypothetical protein
VESQKDDVCCIQRPTMHNDTRLVSAICRQPRASLPGSRALFHWPVGTARDDIDDAVHGGRPQRVPPGRITADTQDSLVDVARRNRTEVAANRNSSEFLSSLFMAASASWNRLWSLSPVPAATRCTECHARMSRSAPARGECDRADRAWDRPRGGSSAALFAHLPRCR